MQFLYLSIITGIVNKFDRIASEMMCKTFISRLLVKRIFFYLFCHTFANQFVSGTIIAFNNSMSYMSYIRL